MRSNSPAGKKKLLLERILYDKNGWDQKADSRYFMHTSMLTHKVKGMQWVKEKRNCVERRLGAECITYMVPFNLHHGYVHWPLFYPWNTQSPEGLFSPGSPRARMRTWDWLDGKGHALCLSYYCYSKTSRSTASDQEDFDSTTVNTKCVISLQTQRELEEFF